MDCELLYGPQDGERFEIAEHSQHIYLPLSTVPPFRHYHAYCRRSDDEFVYVGVIDADAESYE